MSSKLKTVLAAYRRAVIKLLKKADPTEEPQQDVVNLRSMMELIKTKQKTLSDLNEKILESFEEEDLDEEIEEVDRYDLREYHRASGKHTGQVNIGDVVQLGSESPRPLWRLGTIEYVVKGGDRLIRAAKVRTYRELVTTRPIVKLYLLEL
ncbi:Hypothetical predicted protein [Mytilus galloprovincialis]|uniref:DUF5641 domain-containing protein n=1 Tax=Mytilus galloprovincialis TaxID=29158 RepID=A0A8B6C6I7_MYTGA|nr:Hypothetical predicted protein [Mytilus galloprovincialis]